MQDWTAKATNLAHPSPYFWVRTRLRGSRLHMKQRVCEHLNVDSYMTTPSTCNYGTNYTARGVHVRKRLLWSLDVRSCVIGRCNATTAGMEWHVLDRRRHLSKTLSTGWAVGRRLALWRYRVFRLSQCDFSFSITILHLSHAHAIAALSVTWFKLQCFISCPSLKYYWCGSFDIIWRVSLN